jgi:hypothetical protein
MDCTHKLLCPWILVRSEQWDTLEETGGRRERWEREVREVREGER